MRRGLAALKSYLWCARLCGLSEKRLRAVDGAEKRSETHFCLTINIGTRVLVHFSRCRVTTLRVRERLLNKVDPLHSATSPATDFPPGSPACCRYFQDSRVKPELVDTHSFGPDHL